MLNHSDRPILYISAIAFSFISVELMMSTLIQLYEVHGVQSLIIVIPALLFAWTAIWFTSRILVPKYLLRDKYESFFIFTYITAFITLMAYMIIENIQLHDIGLPSRLPLNSWRFLPDRLSNSLILTLILICPGIWRLYCNWMEENRLIDLRTGELREYIDNVRRRLDRDEIVNSIDQIERTLSRNPETSQGLIKKLSDYLRRQLYELPVPPIRQYPETPIGNSRLMSFLSSPHKRPLRYLLIESMFILMACGGYLEEPDGDKEVALITAIAVFLVLNILYFFNRFVLFRRFSRKHNIRNFFLEITVVVLIMIAMVVIPLLSPEKAENIRQTTPIIIIVLAGIGALASIVMLIGGTSAILVLKHNIRARQKGAMISSLAVREEYLFLKKQINPHFLFNILNGIYILSADDPEEAGRMLGDLKKLIIYQFDEASSEFTSLNAEVDFLTTYLILEQKRNDDMRISIDCRNCNLSDRIPTLLLMPLVENAVKHGYSSDGRERYINLIFETEGRRFTFICRNSYSGQSGEFQDLKSSHFCESEAKVGGLGLRNLQRRLDLLYTGNASLTFHQKQNEYIATLSIPTAK